MERELENQTAIITGGNAGIGKAIALKFAKEGARVLIFGMNAEKGKQAVQEIHQAINRSDRAYFYSVDVSQTNAVEETIKETLKSFDHIDILVNNAGVTADQLLMKMTEAEWDRVLDTNLKSCYNTCHAIVRPMMKRKRGKIINIGSVVGLTGNIGQVNYAASKAGMVGFTKALAKELASRSILVNCIAPGFIQTSMTESLSEAQKELILKGIPLGKMGNVEDIANTAWFLASSLSNYLTGQVISVDGGMAM